MTERKTLLKRYGIPLNHLDFQYVNECNDPREIERIVHVLQSGEEGFYPDLTKCAEDKLRLLKPNSRLFRCEVNLIRGDEINETDLQTIKEFSRTARDRDRRLAAAKDEEAGLPPIRNPGKISLSGKDKNDENTSNVNAVGAGDQPIQMDANKNTGKKISATDYRKWDRYDPDEEILRMDLAEERAQEEIERKNRLNAQKSVKAPLIEEISEEQERIKTLTDIERETLAEEYRLRGNEYFRAKEYDFALTEYTRAISLDPENNATAYNNRAITFIKLKKYSDAIKDCQKCLSIEPNNIKAMYRLALSNMESGFKEKALEIFTKVLELDPNHTNAKNFVNTLRNQVGETAPANATRLRIEEGPTSTKSAANNVPKVTKTSNKDNQTKRNVTKNEEKLKTQLKTKEYDLASVVRPKEIVPNKWMDTAASILRKSQANDDKNNTQTAAEIQTKTKHAANDDKDMELLLPMMNNKANNSRPCKPLIEEL